MRASAPNLDPVSFEDSCPVAPALGTAALRFLYARVKPMARISSKHQVTLPVESLEAAGLRAGDEVVIEAEGADRIVVHRAAPDLASALGVFDGLYEPGYLEKLRSEERV